MRYLQQLTSHTVEAYLYSRRITVSACKAAITAAGFVNPSEFPSPASVFFADESVEEHRTDPVRNDVHVQLIHSSHPGPKTFRWLLTQYNPTQSNRLDFHALTSVLAAASRTSYSPSHGEVCDRCLGLDARLMAECRNIGADDLLVLLGDGAPVCTNCFAAGVACEWFQADDEV